MLKSHLEFVNFSKTGWIAIQQDFYESVVTAEILGFIYLEYDSLQRGFAGDVAVGDYFEFRNTGSYSNVVKPPFIMPNFPMITYRDGKISVIKRRERPSDLYATYTFD